MPQSTTALALTTYDRAKQSLALCESVDECKDWADKSAAPEHVNNFETLW